jgi:DNA-binding NarL/FixJ family response regulator
VRSMRVLVADDHALFRKGVVSLLRHTAGFTVVGEARDGREAVAKAQGLLPDVVVMDVYMSEMGGLEATRQITATVPSVKIVILTVSEEDHVLFEAVKAGAHGYLLKDVEPEELFRTLRGAVQGEAFITPSMAARILGEFTRQARPAQGAAAALTPREREVLALLTRGAVNKEIAVALHISGNTVKNHLKSIMEKLHAENRVQVVARALRQGLVRPPEPP